VRYWDALFGGTGNRFAGSARHFYSRARIRYRFGRMSLLRMIFVWWRGATLGTLVTTWWSGKYVGADKYGNRYYQTADGKRRWVLYNGTVEASRVPPDWHGWLHHTFKDAPTVAPFASKSWEKEHLPNLSGTPDAYRPEGSLTKSGRRPHATGDYEAWKPE
jgi:NADH:ubiquinone oxidoreductase subunit